MKKPNPKKDKSARRKRNLLYWQTGGRQILSATMCRECIKLQRIERAEQEKKEPAPHGMKYNLNQSVKCKSCYVKPKNNIAKQRASQVVPKVGGRT